MISVHFGDPRHGRVVRMKPRGRHDEGFNQAKRRIKRRANRFYRVGHGRERDRHPLHSVMLGLCVQGLMLAVLLEQKPRSPRTTAWNGAGDWLIFSKSRQLDFSRTVSTTFNLRGTDFQRSGSRLRGACASDCRRSIHTP